jgi:hypothetical protein
METKYIVIVLIMGMVLTAVALCGEAFKDKVAAELVKDMASMGYYQKEVKGKVLWVKDEK